MSRYGFRTMINYFQNLVLVLISVFLASCGQYGTSVSNTKLEGEIQPAGGVRAVGQISKGSQPQVDTQQSTQGKSEEKFISSLKVIPNGSLAVTEGVPGIKPYILITIPVVFEAETPYGSVRTGQLIQTKLKLVSSDKTDLKVGWSQTFFEETNRYQFNINENDGGEFAAAYKDLTNQMKLAYYALVINGFAKSSTSRKPKTFRLENFEMSGPMKFSGSGPAWHLSFPDARFDLIIR